MDRELDGRHVRSDELVDYFEGQLSPEQIGAIEKHFGECAKCTALARGLHASMATLAALDARTQGAAFQRDRLTRAIEHLEEAARTATAQSWLDRLRRWRTRGGGQVEAAVRIVMGVPGTVSRITTAGLEALTRPGSPWQFSTVAAPAAVRGEDARRDQIPLVATAPGSPGARLQASGDAREIVARLDDWPEDRVPPLILLLPAEGKGKPRIAEARRATGQGYLYARFEDIDAGEYVLAFEPDVLPPVPG